MAINKSNLHKHGLTPSDMSAAIKVLAAIPVNNTLIMPYIKVVRTSEFVYEVKITGVEEDNRNDNILFEDPQ